MEGNKYETNLFKKKSIYINARCNYGTGDSGTCLCH